MTGLDRLTDEDVRILRLESGSIRGHTCKVVVAGPTPGGHPPRLEALRAHVAARLGAFPRLRRRLAGTPLGIANPAWVSDPGFDVARHVVSWQDGAPVGPARLRAIVADLMAERLEHDRPLWRIDMVEPLEDGGAALVVRLHHCLADGVTAGSILSQVVLDSDEPPSPPPDGGAAPGEGDAPGTYEMLALGVRDRARGAAAGIFHGARLLASPAAWRDVVETARRLPATIRRDLLPGGDDSPLDAPAGPARVVAFFTRPLEDVRRISKAFAGGVTVNDVVLAAVGGGLRCWLERKGALAHELRAKVPVSLHQAGEDADSSANRDSFMVVSLGLEHADPVERLLAVSAATEDRKRHHDAEEIDSLLHDLAHVSRSLERLAERWAIRPGVFAANVSNVPGPRGELSVLGAPVREVHSLAEIANRHALRVSIFSAGGALSFGLCADASLTGEIDVVSAGVQRELDELLERAGRP